MDTPTASSSAPGQTTYPLDYANIPVIDLAAYDTPNGKADLVRKLKSVVEGNGFFYLVNFGLSESEVEQQWNLGREILALSPEEKLKYRAKLEEGDYNGYRPLGAIEQFPGRRDNWECHQIYKFLPENQRPQPQPVMDHIDSIEAFQRHVHEDVAYKVLRLIALVLEMPEDFFVDHHRYEEPCSSFLRYMKYYPRTSEVNRAYEQTYTRAHSDFGSVTFLFSQPVAGLELQNRDGSWQAVKHMPGSIVVNTADMLNFWTNGYLQSCVHRVASPPPDQEMLERFGLIYFLRPSNKTCLKAVDSPVLRRLGLDRKQDTAEEQAKREMTVGDWALWKTKRNWTPYANQTTQEKGNALQAVEVLA